MIEAKAGDSARERPLLEADAIAPTSFGTPSPEFLTQIDHDFARRHLVLSEGLVDGSENLAISDRTRALVPFNVGVQLGRPIRTRHASAESLAIAIDHAYSQSQRQPDSKLNEGPKVVVEGSSNVEFDLAIAIGEAERDLLSTQGKAPTVRLVDLIIFEAVVRGASDVHIQPTRDRTLVRYRLDGALHTTRVLPGSLASAVVTRVKVMARLDIAEQRSPQDGRASVTVNGSQRGSGSRAIDLRVSTLPSTYGERVVLRLLDPARSPHLMSFSALGMPPTVERQYLAQIERSSGIVLSTGPTGSGKTTTLYASLTWINTTNAGAQSRGCELNMLTVEDPVEYDLAAAGLAVSQTQVDPRKNLTFATGLRHILRQDPDVIMVGEVRDEETARIAVQASLTGHLVLSTLHTNDAASAIARLIDLSVEPFLLSSSLNAVLAQRLVRRVHKACDGRGCAECMSTGYKGRAGVFELLVMDAGLREMVTRRATAQEVKAEAQRRGMATLREAGEELVRQGVTSSEELRRVVESSDEETVA